jgi:hypothetical protein
MLGKELGLGGAVPLLIQQFSQAVDGSQPAAGLLNRQLLQAVDEIGGFLAGEQAELGCMVLAQSVLFAPQLGNQLLTHQLALLAFVEQRGQPCPPRPLRPIVPIPVAHRGPVAAGPPWR